MALRTPVVDPLGITCSAVGFCSCVPSRDTLGGVETEGASGLFHSREYPVLSSLPKSPGVCVSAVVTAATAPMREGGSPGDVSLEEVGVAVPDLDPDPIVAIESAEIPGYEDTGCMRERVPTESSRPCRIAARPRDMV